MVAVKPANALALFLLLTSIAYGAGANASVNVSVSTSLSQSAFPPSTQYVHSIVTFTCDYRDDVGAHIAGASCNVSIDSSGYPALDSGSAYAYSTPNLTVGSHSWFCACAKIGYIPQNGTPQGYSIISRASSPGDGSPNQLVLKVEGTYVNEPFLLSVRDPAAAGVSGAEIRIIRRAGPMWLLVGTFFTDSKGQAVFTPAQSGDYAAQAFHPGFLPAEKYFEVNRRPVSCVHDSDCLADEYCFEGTCRLKKPIGAECAEERECLSALCPDNRCVECMEHPDCPETEECVGQSCVPVGCPCGFIQNHTCIEYECCTNDDCADGEACEENSCIGVECPCGFIQNHACIEYECCLDSDCPQGQSCDTATNTCQAGNRTMEVEIPEGVEFGEEFFITVRDAEGNPLPGVTIHVIYSDGREETIFTGADGRAGLNFDNSNSANLTLDYPGYHSMNVTVGAPPPPCLLLWFIPCELLPAIVFALLCILIIAGGAALLLRSKAKAPTTKPKARRRRRAKKARRGSQLRQQAQPSS